MEIWQKGIFSQNGIAGKESEKNQKRKEGQEMRDRQRMKKFCAGLLAALLAVQPLAQPVTAQAAETTGDSTQTETSGDKYYFSTLHEDSGEDGSKENPYKSLEKLDELDIEPGDQILLERGSVFEDQYIHLEDKGDSEGEPIIIAPYGEGTERPRINTNGEGVWYQDYGANLDNTAHKRQGDVSSSILLKDTENIEISGLEITNWVETEADGKAYNDVNLIDRTGVAGMAQNRGTLEHIVLDDLYIHDVKGNIVNKHMLNGGIYFICALPEDMSSKDAAISPERVPKFDGLTIENCHLENVCRWGIAAAYTIYHSKFGSKVISDETAQTYGSSNVVIRNNYLNDIGGDAITTMYCFRPLVEGNVSQGAARDIRSDHWPANTGHRVAAGIWPWKCKDSIFQRNECFDMKNYLTGNQDAQAWDADWGDGTIYQYNYSHGNSGGCIMFCGQQAYRTTFRYNISQNDLRGLLCIPGNPDGHVYNNTFYVKEGVPVVPNDFGNGVAHVENNIFYYAGSTPGNGNWHPNNSRVSYNNNLYYNYASLPQDDTNAVIGDGKLIFQNEGTAPAAAQENGKIHDLSAFAGYQLAAGSPAIDAGKKITDDNGYTMEQGYTDFFEREVDLQNPDLGAAQAEESPAAVLRILSDVYEIHTEGVDGTNTIQGVEPGTLLEDFMTNLIWQEGGTITVKSEGQAIAEGTAVRYPMTVELVIGTERIVYTLVPNTEAELVSSLFMVDESETENHIYVPSQPLNPCKVSDLVDGLAVSRAAEVSVWNGEEAVSEGNVEEGMTVRITSEDGNTTVDYAVVIKNEYHWIKDYVDAQQGNVWFAQSKTGTEGFTNLTSYDRQYATWNLSESYACVGAEGNKNEVTADKHGLICDFRAEAPTPAMAFRAPSTGMVSFKLLDSEPYLRQNGNSGGSVILGLYVNDETEPRQSCELSVSMQKGNFPEVELYVEAGDFIRLQALTVGTPSKPSVFATPIVTYLNKEVDLEAPEVPAAFTYDELTQTSVLLKWEASASEDVSRYRIENLADQEIILEADADQNEYLWENLTQDTEYQLAIYAVDTSDNVSEGKSLTFKTLKEVVEKPWAFDDVKENPQDWKYINVKYVYDREIMNGIAGTRNFNPNGKLNRAMFATVLYRMAGSPDVTFDSTRFKDVKAGQYYSAAVIWANDQKIVEGFSDGTYGVNTNIQRDQIAAMLYRYANAMKFDTSEKKALTAFTDADKISSWALEPLQWATAVGMITGKPNDAANTSFRIAPKEEATRAECAKMLTGFMKKYQP